MPLDVGPHLLGCHPHIEDAADEALEYHLAQLSPGDFADSVERLFERGFAAVVAAFRRFEAERGATPAGPISAPRDWLDAAALNQGRTGHCVGFGWAGWCAAAPTADAEVDADGHAIYYAAKVIDGEPGQEGGSTVRSGAQLMQDVGRVVRLGWTRNAQSVADWITSVGPVVVGTPWTQSMFTPDAEGVIRPGGPVAGGHCYLLHGFDAETSLVRLRNSWGAEWGRDGDAFIALADLQELLDTPGGVACAAVEVAAAVEVGHAGVVVIAPADEPPLPQDDPVVGEEDAA